MLKIYLILLVVKDKYMLIQQNPQPSGTGDSLSVITPWVIWGLLADMSKAFDRANHAVLMCLFCEVVRFPHCNIRCYTGRERGIRNKKDWGMRWRKQSE